MNTRKKKAFTLLLVVLAAAISLSLPVLGSENPVHIFEQSTYFTNDHSLYQGRIYEVAAKKVCRVEDTATLYVGGEFRISGTLKNYGTLVIRNEVQPAYRSEAEASTQRGLVTNKGRIENYGTIIVQNATLENQPTGHIENKGTIVLQGNTPDLSALVNVSRSTGSGVQAGSIYNAKGGRIDIETTQGVGLRNNTGAILENDGVITMIPGAEARGVLAGNAVVWASSVA